jgi:hypothetical protein
MGITHERIAASSETQLVPDHKQKENQADDGHKQENGEIVAHGLGLAQQSRPPTSGLIFMTCTQTSLDGIWIWTAGESEHLPGQAIACTSTTRNHTKDGSVMVGASAE